jgi:hypothetical protein
MNEYGLKQRSKARILDQFYTQSDVAQWCVDKALHDIGPIKGTPLFIEPSAGSGAFLDVLPNPCIGMDIAPPSYRKDIQKQDFLQWHPQKTADTYIVIGNPPFGKNASLALKFIRHAAGFADFVAFILPRTFEKDTFKSRISEHFLLLSQSMLNPASFLHNGAVYSVPVVFQIWQRSLMQKTDYIRELVHPDFEFVKSPHSADFAFQRVGARAGLVSKEGLGKSPQSHYFIKSRKDSDVLMRRLSRIDWNNIKSRTAGNPSIGKSELISEYKRAFQ